MKTSVLAAFAASLAVGIIAYFHQPKTPSVPAVETVTEAEPSSAPLPPLPRRSDAPIEPAASPLAVAAPVAASVSPAAVAFGSARVDAINLGQTIDTLVSRQATYEQKRAAWKQLADTGKLDRGINELEQRMTADPRTADYPATLGQAYLKKCALLHDVREQGILAMQADKVFDTALSLDPSNWEARFTKAVALSYWPATMNKSEEVMQHFQTLIQQQETLPPQPQFAQVYACLGDQYQKAGYPDFARAVWERGAGLFPSDDGLKSKLVAR